VITLTQSATRVLLPDASTFSDAIIQENTTASTLLSTQALHKQQDPTIELTATMSIKRKRSSGSLFQTPTLETSPAQPFLSSPIRLPNFFVQSKAHDPHSPFTPKQHTQQEEHTSQNLNSRTRKRYRDARPEESQIHGM
jgi:hypothetical protein